MSSARDNFSRKGRWKMLVPLAPIALLPLSVVGFSLRPAIEYGALSDDLERARSRFDLAGELARFEAQHDDQGPPTDRCRELLAELASRVPVGFEASAFFERCLSAKRAADVVLGAIDIGAEHHLHVYVGEQLLQYRLVTLQGRARLFDLERMLGALHSEGQPVGVLEARLDALESDPSHFEFQLQLAVYHLAGRRPVEQPIEEL
jgi:hypothetical protein